jgi:predicted nucleotidyltransferase
VGGGVNAPRRAEYERILDRLAAWASVQADIVAIAVVGSWARGQPRMDSDIDAVVLTTDTARYTGRDDWVAAAAGHAAPIVRRQDWGVLQERRVRLPSGLEVEYGFVPPSWAATEPVDAGTRDVAEHGFHPIYDPHGILQRLSHAIDDTR